MVSTTVLLVSVPEPATIFKASYMRCKNVSVSYLIAYTSEKKKKKQTIKVSCLYERHILHEQFLLGQIWHKFLAIVI